MLDRLRLRPECGTGECGPLGKNCRLVRRLKELSEADSIVRQQYPELQGTHPVIATAVKDEYHYAASSGCNRLIQPNKK